MREKMSTTRTTGRLLAYLTLAVGGVLFLVPFFWMLSISVKTPVNLAVYPIRFWPEQPEWSNYLEVLRRATVPRYMLNSAVISTTYAEIGRASCRVRV